jgi:uncharacterized membrane protein
MVKKIINKHFVTIGLIAIGIFVLAWSYVITIHPFIMIFITVLVSELLVLRKKIKRRKSS